MTVWARDERALWRRSGARVLLAPPVGDILLLEDTGALIWLLLDRLMSQAELVADLQEWFDDGADTIAAEVAAFLQQLRELEAVTAR